MRASHVILGLLLLRGLAALGADPAGLSVADLKLVRERLRPLHTVIAKPGPDDWLAHHAEPGQTFEEYLASRPVTPTGRRVVIYLQPLGDFTPTQQKILDLTAEFVHRYYSREVKVRPGIPLAQIPATARRKDPAWGMEQLLTTYVLDDVLRAALPPDAACIIALTASDLWAGPGWNFVFGQASLTERTGVWSMYRNGNPDRNPAEFRLCLLRTLKTAVHEIGHMFGMQHCTAYECCMCGSNHRDESDRRPLWLCPECVTKVCWATQADPAARYAALAKFCSDQRLDAEAWFYRRSAAALAPARAAPTPR